MQETLYIVMPAYNEAENIEAAVHDWYEVVRKIGSDSRLVVVDDGSTDTTPALLGLLEKELTQLVVYTKKNGGHGAACLAGYRFALEQKPDYVFQTDSDGQTCPDDFWMFWELRNRYDVQIGRRVKRQDGWSRRFVAFVLKLVILGMFRLRIPDANCPFRLMRATTLAAYLPKVPEDYFLSNILLAIIFTKYHVSQAYHPITFLPRRTGVNSVHIGSIVRIGRQALRDFFKFRANV
ncbi:MAG TPA: glycosyltransferase family 2 protein [bacterium]|nr:glycosyltransferase family 2 protein [bacterium]